MTFKKFCFQLDGRMYHSHFSYSAGGVGRNICESLFKLGVTSNFLTVVGNDEQGKLVEKSIPLPCSNLLLSKDGSNTAQCVIVFNELGDCKMLMGDMEIHKQITPDMVSILASKNIWTFSKKDYFIFN